MVHTGPHERTGHRRVERRVAFHRELLAQKFAPGAPALPSPSQLGGCLNRLGVHTLTTYQPASRFGTFQGIEFAVYAVLAVALVAVAARAVRHRLA